MTRRASLSVILALGLLSFPGCARAPSLPFAAAERCRGPSYHRLDFWLGEWDVASPAGTVEGSNEIVATLDGCAVEERWLDAAGGRGTSLFFFDRALGRWKQVWATDRGT